LPLDKMRFVGPALEGCNPWTPSLDKTAHCFSFCSVGSPHLFSHVPRPLDLRQISDPPPHMRHGKCELSVSSLSGFLLKFSKLGHCCPGLVQFIAARFPGESLSTCLALTPHISRYVDRAVFSPLSLYLKRDWFVLGTSTVKDIRVPGAVECFRNISVSDLPLYFASIDTTPS
jgi:hypothetical protein